MATDTNVPPKGPIQPVGLWDIKGKYMFVERVWPVDEVWLIVSRISMMMIGMSVRLILGTIVEYYIRKTVNVRYTTHKSVHPRMRE